MATVQTTLRELRALGKEGTARIYARHGVSDPVLGVSYASLARLVKRLGVDHELALGLWDTGVHEARVLATRIADPERLSRARVARWLKHDLRLPRHRRGLGPRRAGPGRPGLGEEWVDARHEWTSAAGWNVISILAMDGRLSTRSPPAPASPASVGTIARAPNRSALLDERRSDLHRGQPPRADRPRPRSTARTIGPVEVDHGQTGCRTPDAIAYIRKMSGHRAGARRTRITGGPQPRPRTVGGARRPVRKK